MKKNFIILLIGIVLTSCGSKRTITQRPTPKEESKQIVTKPEEPKKEVVIKPTTKTYANATEAYIDTYKIIAQNEMKEYGIPASITLAQGILESGSGKGRLSVQANNHFGIKCHGWTGEKIYHDDDALQECFRKYDSANGSFRDHSLFLSKRKRYAKLFKLRQEDYKGWARELRAAGYATDRKYPQKLISLIERYKLYKFDKEVLGGNYTPVKEVTAANSNYVVYKVNKGDTLYSISRKYNTTVKALQELNNLNGNNLSIGQELKIQPSKS